MNLVHYRDAYSPFWGEPEERLVSAAVAPDSVEQVSRHIHSGMEAVMPDGEIVRTGMGALPGAKTWGEYRYGFGPTLDGLFAQGNVGIVTKMGFHLFPAPEAYQTSTVTVPRRRDIIPLAQIVNELEYSGAIRTTEALSVHSDRIQPSPRC